MLDDSGRIERERDHWDHAIPTPAEVVDEFEKGPDPNTQAMIDAVEPAPGRHIIDFACGGGVTSLWLAARGARVTGIDLSPKSIDVARRAAELVGLSVEFLVADLEEHDLPGGYDGMVGRYALHHLDVAALAPAMARAIKPGASAAFVETMDTNPLLRLSRKHLTGRFGVARYGTLDEHPLVRADLTALRAAFGHLELRAAEYQFLRIFDRQVLRFRSPAASRVLRAADEGLARVPGIRDWSYHQVLVARRV